MLIHMDVKRLGLIPDGGGHPIYGMQQGKRNRPGSGRGYEFIRSAVSHNVPATCRISLEWRVASTIVLAGWGSSTNGH
ncbi:hypothetical protein MIC448_1140030 [Microbacterium sp. C448]|uniref:hypothetical protein n=1 Tax=Microbacterium sp. C448 TaxID=1177594 RepID=UPI0003DDF7F1|nr:hypothetical protein MIC448_1140030 [Microbacterium sp. C448]